MKKKRITAIIIMLMLLMSVFVLNTADVSAASKDTYQIKVNTQTNVVTIYKKSGKKYKPIKAMVCSSGGKLTPTGTFRLKQKIGWCKLVGNVWGQYSTVINGNYLFHSVPYSKKAKNKIIGKEYNKLGTSCSHGCIRLSVMDAKWISEMCPQGTKVVIFRSKSKGPLGKPKPLKVSFKHGWDPTDPDSKNPNFRMPGPVIKISSKKSKTVSYGGSYNIKKYVTAKDPNTFKDLTSAVKVHGIYLNRDGKWVKVKSLDTKKSAKYKDKVAYYKITYKAYYKYCRQTSRLNFYVSVTDNSKPEFKGVPQTMTVTQGETVDLLKGITAKQKSCDRTKAINTTVMLQGDAGDEAVSTPTVYSYDDAKKYKFTEFGEYTVTYSVTNKYKSSLKTSKTVHYTVKPDVSGTERR